MGGRGVYAGDRNSQIKVADYLQMLEIKAVRQEMEACRAEAMEGSRSVGSVFMRKRCACCLQYTLPAYSEYEQCPVCGWIDDPIQNLNPQSASGLNPTSLQEAQQKWLQSQQGTS